MQSSYLGGLSTADSDYRVNETRQFARMLGLKSKNTAVRSPVSNGIAESFMKTIKRDYISIMPKLVVCFLWSSLCSVLRKNIWHCCKVSDEAAFCLIQRPYISKTLLTRRISPRGSP